jgi:hypothetical protein
MPVLQEIPQYDRADLFREFGVLLADLCFALSDAAKGVTLDADSVEALGKVLTALVANQRPRM